MIFRSPTSMRKGEVFAIAQGHLADDRAVHECEQHWVARSCRSWTAPSGRDCESTAAPVSCLSMLVPHRRRAAFTNLGEFTLPATSCLTRRAALGSHRCEF